MTFRITGADSGGELLEVEFELAAGGELFATHVHPRSEERFEITSGRLVVSRAGQHVLLERGEHLSIPAGVAHTVRNPGPERGIAIVAWRPAGRMGEVLEFLFRVRHEGRMVAGKPEPLRLAACVAAYPDEIYLARIPIGFQKLAAGLLAPAGRSLMRRDERRSPGRQAGPR
jgi:mannose-6-phosphate isomerase-like protein (cupin superfamily)